jgi:heme exporter protein D
MSEFFAMGGYAAYVWPAYAATALVLGGLAFLIWRRGRDLKRRIKAFEAEKND